MKQKKKNGYNLDDFGLLFSEASEKSMLLRKKNSVADSAKGAESKPLNITKDSAESSGNNSSLRDSAKQNRGNLPIEKIQDLQSGLPRSPELARNDNYSDSANSQNLQGGLPRENPQSKEQDFIYAPQFQGFDEILAQSKNASAQNFSPQDFSAQDFSAPQNDSAESSAKVAPQSEKDLLLSHTHTHNDTNALFVAYSILFLMLLIFMPQVYLANNIYTSSKNINLLKSQKDALRDENSDLQKRLESVKFNFLTLEIEEIK